MAIGQSEVGTGIDIINTYIYMYVFIYIIYLYLYVFICLWVLEHAAHKRKHVFAQKGSVQLLKFFKKTTGKVWFPLD